MGLMEISPVGTLFVGEDKLICALYCALIIGMGVGLVVRVGGSTGGMDIPPSSCKNTRASLWASP